MNEASDSDDIDEADGGGTVFDEKSSAAEQQHKSCDCQGRCATRKCPCKFEKKQCTADCHPGRTCGNKNAICSTPCSQEVITVDDHLKVKNLWVKVGCTMLLLDDKVDILQGKWLTDNILFSAEQLLHQQFPAISGLQDPNLQRTLTFEVQKNKEFVQCLNMGGNHWITVSSVGCKAGTVRVYDSMNRMLKPAVKKVLAYLVCTESKSFTVEYMRMQYQIGGADCGLFAIASACSICNGEDPSGHIYNQAVMRQHLVTAFETNLLSPFPTLKRMEPIIRQSEAVSVY